MFRRAWLPSLLLVLALAGCSRCGKEAGPAAGTSAAGPARYLPRDARAAVVINDLGALGEKLARFQNLKVASFAAQMQNFPTAEGYVSAVMKQVGVDLRSRQALETAGIDPGRGAGAAFLGGNRAVSIVGVKDADKLTETFGNFARTRLGASEKKDASVDGGKLVTFGRPNAPEPSLGLLFLKGTDFALLGAGPSIATLGTLATLPQEKSLASEPVLAASLQRLPSERDFHVWIPGGTGFIVPPGTVEGITLTGRIENDAVTLRADAPWPDTQASLAALDAVKDAADLSGALPADSFLVARFRGDPSHLDGAWPYLAGGYITRAVQKSGLDMKGEVLDNFKPGMVLGVSLSPTVNLGAGMPALDLRRTNPFRFVHLVALADTEDAAKTQSTLEKLPAMADDFGAKVEPADLSGQRVYLTSYRAGEGAHFALGPNGRLVMAAPKARLESTLASLAKPAGGSPVADDLKDAGKDAAFSVVLDLRRLSDAVKNLPSEAWGIGGFAIKATTVRWLEATDDLRAVTLAVSRKEKALQAELSLRLTPGAAAAGSTTTQPATP
ncbi:hypothetical protein HPC49_32775 [Pyxidicoccus fallax]|uniref:Lipoprotein n=1 Tax=Pyxidicoccus fallax TaxID=394095 RepID=A0A848LU53_9BACT|nr:hypothetical protein [Pyxidicoccus fallax]NMO21316.1 hypothetical protein [Pyxidicoccus fallax]NPC82985.1 hypothetical protein [Pyxidicoccus fallax]